MQGLTGESPSALGLERHLIDRHQSLRVRKRQRPQHHRPDRREHRAVRPDAERQCRHQRRREPRRMPERPRRMAEVRSAASTR